VESENGELRFEQLVPPVELLRRVKDYLDRRRVIGTRVLVTPPDYHGFTIAAKLLALREFDAGDVRRRTIAALYEAFGPITGGRDGKGWEFGRHVLEGDVYAVLQSVRGVDRIDDCRLFDANPVTGERTPLAAAGAHPTGGQPRKPEVQVSQYATVFSYRHYVFVGQQ
jgi:predicted phage baseplate assembly protein